MELFNFQLKKIPSLLKHKHIGMWDTDKHTHKRTKHIYIDIDKYLGIQKY